MCVETLLKTFSIEGVVRRYPYVKPQNNIFVLQAMSACLAATEQMDIAYELSEVGPLIRTGSRLS